MPQTITIVSVVRHGHGTARIHVEGLYDSTDVPFRLVYADIASPPPVERYLAERARHRADFTHLRFDHFVSRQTARRAALELVDTPWVVIVDNNMQFRREWLSRLLATAETTGADLVSPTVVVQGGSVHYSGGRIVRRRRLRNLGLAMTYRPQDVFIPARSQLGKTSFGPMDVDFVESHCALGLTELLRIPDVMEPDMHNAFTMLYASYKLKRDHDRRIVYDPAVVCSIVPIGFGYDLPWMCREYMRRDRLEQAYRRLRGLLGSGPATDLSVGLRWHAKHFKYLLLGMLKTGSLESEALPSQSEVPDAISGYDDPLPADADERIASEVVPFLQQRYPECVESVRHWLGHRHRRLRSYLARISTAAFESARSR